MILARNDDKTTVECNVGNSWELERLFLFAVIALPKRDKVKEMQLKLFP